MSARPGGRLPALGGGNLMLASLLAILSYVPFEYVAKGTLLTCVLLFVVDPFPPVSRLLALTGTVVVALLSRLHRNWHEEELQHELQQQQQLPNEPEPVHDDAVHREYVFVEKKLVEDDVNTGENADSATSNKIQKVKAI